MDYLDLNRFIEKVSNGELGPGLPIEIRNIGGDKIHRISFMDHCDELCRKHNTDRLRLLSVIQQKLNGDMGKLSGFEYFGDNCSSFMEHHEHFFSNDYKVGVYIQIPLFNIEMDDAVENWYQILMNFEYINKDEQILSLNDPNNWKTFFEARHSIPANALQKSKNIIQPV